MAQPDDRKSLQQYCLRQLGAPVVQINVSQEQVDDRTDDALQFFAEFHFDGVERAFYPYVITQEDIDNQYLSIPDEITSIIQMYPISNTSSAGIFSVEYQMFLQDFFNLRRAGSLIDYAIARQYLALIQDLFSREKSIEFNRHINKVFIKTNWAQTFQVGNYVLFEVYTVVDPEIYSDVFNDMMLKRYLTALLKRQWGANLMKFNNIQLPGGTTLNGIEIYNEGKADVEKIEAEIRDGFSYPVDFFVG